MSVSSKLEQSVEGHVDHLQGEDLIPLVDNSWTEEFVHGESEYKYPAVGFVTFIGGAYYSFIGMRARLSHDHPCILLAFWIDQLFGAICFAFGCLLTFKIFRPLAINFFDVVLVCVVIMNYCCQMLAFIAPEVNYSQAEHPESPVQLKINYSGPWPVRLCNDIDPLETWTSLAMKSPFITCNNVMLSGDTLSRLIVFAATPFVFQFESRAAMYFACLLSVIFTVACVLLGSGWGIAFPLTVQLAVSVTGIHYSHIRSNLSRQWFVILKRTQLTAERNRALIQTFIPKNVLQKLELKEYLESDAMLSASIPCCTVMFCCLEPQDDIQEAPTEDVLRLMNTIFSQFDEQVERFGMFKYQHVGDWYIVACPRAACPFDTQEQQKPYPTQHLTSMVLLADALRTIAEMHRLRGVPLWLRAGIHYGPLVGAVVGLVKAFYCLYGDTVNTAARMCKYSGRDHILASAAFVDALRATRPEYVHCDEPQEILVKGKGAVITIRITVSRRASFTIDPRRTPFTRTSFNPESPCTDQDFQGSCSYMLKLLGLWRLLWAWIRAVFQETSLENVVNVKADDMSADGGMLARSEGYRLWPVSGCFRDSEVERRFLMDNSVEHRAALSGSILIFLLCAALHLQQCAYPEFPLDFHGLPELAVPHGRMLAILAVHLVLSMAYCVAMIAAVWRNPRWCPQCRRHFAAARMVYLAASALAWWVFPGMWRWSICYCVNVVLMLDNNTPSLRTRWCSALPRRLSPEPASLKSLFASCLFETASLRFSLTHRASTHAQNLSCLSLAPSAHVAASPPCAPWCDRALAG